jgi:hypothetical protein
MKMDLREIRLGLMDWINVAHNRDQWLAIVNMVTILRVS